MWEDVKRAWAPSPLLLPKVLTQRFSKALPYFAQHHHLNGLQKRALPVGRYLQLSLSL